MNHFINPSLIILWAAVLRLVPHEPNFTPIAAMALFGGAYLSRRWALIVPLATMLLSDYLLLYVNPFEAGWTQFTLQSPLGLFHSTMPFVYASFLISSLIGIWLHTHKKPIWILTGSLLASMQFFVISNFGVWATGYYPQNIGGLTTTYLAAIPFFKGTLLGDLFYTALFFGSYELISRLIQHKKLALEPQSSNMRKP